MPSFLTPKAKEAISNPMPLLPKRVALPHDAKSQRAIAEEYRSLAILEPHGAHTLHTRTVSNSQLDASPTSHRPRVLRRNTVGVQSLPAFMSTRHTASHRRAASSDSQQLLPAIAYQPPLPTGRRQIASELRLDVGPIYQHYILAAHALNKSFVGGVSRTSRMFLNSLNRKRENLLVLPEEIRMSQEVEQAWRETKIWESLFLSHCSKIRVGLDPQELQMLFTTAQTLLESTWRSLGSLIHICSDKWLEYSGGLPGTFEEDSDAREDEASLEEIHDLLEKSSKGTTSSPQRSFAQSLLSRIRPSMLRKKEAKNEPVESDDDSISSFTLIENFSMTFPEGSRPSLHKRATSDTILEVLDTTASADLELSLSLKASKVLFSAVASSFRSLPLRRSGKRTGVVCDEKGTVILATASEFVRILTDPFEAQYGDALGLMDAFFLFFREFLTPRELLHILRTRFEDTPPLFLDMQQTAQWHCHQTLVKLHVVRFTTTWLDRYYLPDKDFSVLRHMDRFIEVVARDRYLPEQAALLIKAQLQTCEGIKKNHKYNVALQQIMRLGIVNAEEYGPTGFETFVPVLQEALQRSDSLPDVLIFCNCGGSEELARAFTVIESEIFHQCPPLNLVGCTEKESHPVFDQMKRWSGAVDLFVSQCIFERRETESRVQVFELFVEVAVLCKNMRNYSSALSLMLGLGATRITRLKTMMSLISERHQAMLAGLKGFFNFRGSTQWQNYRDDLRSQHSPAVPLLVVVKADIIKIKAARELARDRYKPKGYDMQNGQLIDIHLYRKLRDVVRELESCYAPYKLPEESFVLRWLYSSVQPLEDKEYNEYDKKYLEESKVIEPPPAVQHRGSWVQDELWQLGFWD